jgi:hypothetical protein
VSPRWQHAFDHDAATALNEHMPIAVLARVAASPVMPETLRDEIGRAAWTRAVLLGQDDATRDLFPFIERAVPSMTAELSAYRAATTPAARQRSALFLLLKLPGLHPNVAPGLGRDPAYGRPDHPLEPIAQMDPFRDNWWCEAGAFSGMSSYNDPGAPPSNAPAPSFLGEPERTRARTEVAAIRKLPTAAIVLCDRATAWARATPDDPRIPEALYLAIRASHYGCGGRTAASSAAAFRLLKSPRYANTEWAKKAKYYY